ncbi:MAG: CapA family protein [Gammaproteobacteria bacterium]|nr:MAG: CapA family protein [Gammaproteobacteria bacterium]
MQPEKSDRDTVTLFVAGDVMTGRGIDQALPHPGDPRIFEPYSRSAHDYIRLAEQAHGRIPRPVDFTWIWGDALAALERAVPAVRIINLETAVTRRGSPWPRKGIQYRMNPENIPCLTAAAIDCCVLANNHVLDWGYPGLEETLSSLADAGLATAGAGADRATAQAPAVLTLPGSGRVLVIAGGVRSSGIPSGWAATNERPGLYLLEDLSNDTVRDIAALVQAHKRAGDLVVVSLHWGSNWGYPIPVAHRRFAHALIGEADVDLVYGHSSHHPLGMEIYQGKPILYGCGDLINDYEGISGHEEYRSELALLYLVTLEQASGELVSLELVPLRRRRFSLQRADRDDIEWLGKMLARESRLPGARITPSVNASLRLEWT